MTSVVTRIQFSGGTRGCNTFLVGHVNTLYHFVSCSLKWGFFFKLLVGGHPGGTDLGTYPRARFPPVPHGDYGATASKASQLVCLGPFSMLVLYSFSRVSISLKWYPSIVVSSAGHTKQSGPSSEALTEYNIKTHPFIGKKGNQRIMGRNPKKAGK